MKVNVVTLDGKTDGTQTLNKDIFGVDVREDILQRVVTWQLAKRRSGNHSVRRVGEVSGTTKKPFRQKGTGNARQGSLRSLQFRGGATYGPVVRSHAFSLPKKVRKLGLKMALSAKCKDKKISVIKEVKLKAPKSKTVQQLLKALEVKSVLVVDNEVDSNFLKSIANVKHVDIIAQQGLNVYDILQHENLLLTESAIKMLEERLA